MIYFTLFWGFLQVGLFSFGGAYAAIPLIRDIVVSYGWLDDEMLSYMIAVSESTPGPIMVNLATYIGASKAGIPGALIATGAVVLPAFVIIILITKALTKFAENKYVKAVMNGINPCMIGIILTTGAVMIVQNILTGLSFSSVSADIRACIITAVLAFVYFAVPKITKRKISPIFLIIIGAGLGIISGLTVV